MNFCRFSQGLRLGMSPAIADQMCKVYGGSDAPESTPGGGPYNSVAAGDSNSTSTNVSTSMQDQQYKNLLNGSDSWLRNGGMSQTYLDRNWQQGQALSDLSNSSIATQATLNNQGQKGLQQMLGQYDPNATGLNRAIDSVNNRVNFDYNTNVAPQVRQGAVDTGQFGSSRSGIAEGIALSQMSQQKIDGANTLAFQDQQSFNNNKSQLLQNLGNVTSGLSSGYAQANTAYNTQYANDMEKWAYENNVDYNTLAAYKNLVSGDMGGQVKGDGSSNQQQFSYGNAPSGPTQGGGGGGNSTLGTIGMVGGAVIGGIYTMSPQGAMAGAALGGMAGNAMG